MKAKKSELAPYRRQRRKKNTLPFSGLMEITGDLTVGSKQMADEYHAAVNRSGQTLTKALRS